MRRSSYIVNCARAEITDQDAVVGALDSGQLAGYAGDVWYLQPPSATHPWRTMPHNAMTPHVSGSTLSAQARYAAGTREILENWPAARSGKSRGSSLTCRRTRERPHPRTDEKGQLLTRFLDDATARDLLGREQPTRLAALASSSTIPALLGAYDSCRSPFPVISP
jgi:hypothetical protein